MSLPKYPHYKPSGVEWLGDVPAHWELQRLRRSLQLNPSKSEIAGESREKEVSFLPMEAIGDDGTIDLSRTRPVHSVEAGYTYFRDGDVTLAKITPCFENGKGAMMKGLVGGFGFGTTELIVARPVPGRLRSEFLNWVFCSPNFRREGEASMYGAGGQKRVPDDFVRNLMWVLPPVEEQSAIAHFLDHETAKIDALIAEQAKLIDLLAEKRQATISHAVTRGLDPSAPMKDSGVAWLGEVPAHWEVVPLMHLTCPTRPIMYGIVLPGPDVEDGIPIVKGGDVKEHRLKVELLKRTTVEIEAPFARARLKAMDIVYSIRGTIGDAEVVPAELENANITQDVARISPSDSIQTRWLLHVMKSKPVFVQLEQRSLGAAVRGINIFELKRARIPVPPSAERDQIASYLDFETTKLDNLNIEAENIIRLLKERRAALIAAAVTGQIDVRGWRVN